jgi:hypothetical protein
VRKRKKRDDAAPLDPNQATREALDFCFEDLSAVHVVGAAPLTDLTAGRGPAGPASAGAPAEQRSGGQRWNLAVLAALLLTLSAATAAMLLGH